VAIYKIPYFESLKIYEKDNTYFRTCSYQFVFSQLPEAQEGSASRRKAPV
jgi:hypothetical protein